MGACPSVGRNRGRPWGLEMSVPGELLVAVYGEFRVSAVNLANITRQVAEVTGRLSKHIPAGEKQKAT